MKPKVYVETTVKIEFTREFGGAWAPPSRDALDAVSNQIGLW